MKKRNMGFMVLIPLMLMLCGCSMMELSPKNYTADSILEEAREKQAKADAERASAAKESAGQVNEKKANVVKADAVKDKAKASDKETSKTQETEETLAESKEAEDAVSAEVQTVTETEGFRYCYTTLSEKEKLWYEDIKEALFQVKEVRLNKSCVKAGMDEGDIDKIFQCVMNDYPELFYVEGYKYVRYTLDEKTVNLDFTGTIVGSKPEIEVKMMEIENAADQFLAGISQDASDYDKVKYVYDTIIQRTEYQLGASDNQNIYSVFVNGNSVCNGYAKATQYLLNRLGVDTTLVQGKVNDESHAWNLVKVDGEYYYVDTTWGDASYHMGGWNNANRNSISYDYLCITTEQLQRTHTINKNIPMPQCNATSANYFVREDLVLTAYDKERISQIIERAQSAHAKEVTIKCADEAVFAETKRLLLDEQVIFELLEDSGNSISYANNDAQLSLTIWLP